MTWMQNCISTFCCTCCDNDLRTMRHSLSSPDGWMNSMNNNFCRGQAIDKSKREVWIWCETVYSIAYSSHFGNRAHFVRIARKRIGMHEAWNLKPMRNLYQICVPLFTPSIQLFQYYLVFYPSLVWDLFIQSFAKDYNCVILQYLTHLLCKTNI